MQISTRPLLLLPLFTLIAIAALVVPPKAEAVIRLSSPNTTSLSNGLVGYWTFDGSVTDWGTNTTRDISGNGNTGTLSGGMSKSRSPVSGKIGQALSFNGLGNKVAITGPALTSTYTVSMWIYINNLSYYGGLYFDSSNSRGIIFDGSVHKINDIYGGNHYSNTALAEKHWYLVTVVSNAGSVTFYCRRYSD
jgi:hypothetical protein